MSDRSEKTFASGALNGHFAVVARGLGSAVVLTAVGTPFACVPLSGNVEQEMEVGPGVEHVGIGKRMNFETLTPQNLGRTYAGALRSPLTAPRMNLLVN